MDDEQVLAQHIRHELDDISPRRQAFDRWFLGSIGRLSTWVLRHWLLIANLANAIIMAGAVANPLMRAAGWDWLAVPLFAVYHVLCEQRPERSYFLLGYQMALDQRMTAIYASSLIAGLTYIPLRGRLRPLPWRIFFLMSLPMAVDGFTQLFDWRFSTRELRTITGTLFGIGMVWLLYPYLDRAIRPLLAAEPRSRPRAPAPIHHRR